jgi:hypothetical protein
MIETAIAQLHFAASMGLGLFFSPRALNCIIDAGPASVTWCSGEGPSAGRAVVSTA